MSPTSETLRLPSTKFGAHWRHTGLIRLQQELHQEAGTQRLTLRLVRCDTYFFKDTNDMSRAWPSVLRVADLLTSPPPTV
jgi:hypothetical protein